MIPHEHCWHILEQNIEKCCWCGEIRFVVLSKLLLDEWVPIRHGPYASGGKQECPSMTTDVPNAAN